MDKNTILGFVLIALIVIGFSVLNKPNEAELARIQRYNDSIALVEQNKVPIIPATVKNTTDSIATDSTANDTSK
jgi:YidC/Oxa1 family membrane protein insertase